MARDAEARGEEAKPFKCNEQVYVLPSRRNRSLDKFLAHLPKKCMNVRDLNAIGDHSVSVCVLGSALWHTGNTSSVLADVVGGSFCFSLKDLQTNCQARIFVSGSICDGFPNPLQSQLYIYGASIKVNHDFETESQDSRIMLHVNSSLDKVVCIFINRWLYSRLTSKDQTCLVSTLPHPLLHCKPPIKNTINVPATRVSPSSSASNRQEEGESNEERHTQMEVEVDEREGKNRKRKHSDCSKIGHSKTSVDEEPSRKKRPDQIQTEKNKTSDTQTSYHYTELNNLRQGQRLNICGIVKLFKPSFRSRGRDHCTSFVLVDPSQPEDGISVVAFHRDEKQLPQIQRVGNIVVLRRVKINLYQNAPQAVAMYFSSHLVFDINANDPLQPISTSKNASLSRNEIKMIRKMRDWVIKDDRLNSKTHLRKLEDVKPGDHFDIVGEVVSIDYLAAEKCACVSLTDGTKPPFNVTQVVNIPANDERLKKYGDKVVTVAVYDSVAVHMSHISPGNFLYLSNVHANQRYTKSSQGEDIIVVEFCIHRDAENGGSYSVLPETDSDVIALKAKLENIDEGRARLRVPLFQSVTINSHSSRPFSTVSEILNSSQIPGKFRCDLKPVAVSIDCIEKIVKLSCPRCNVKYNQPTTVNNTGSDKFMNAGAYCRNPRCSVELLSQNECPKLVYKYAFGLKLEDSTGSINVSVVNNQAEMFLSNLPPTNLYLNYDAREATLSRFIDLFGFNPFNPDVKQTATTRMDCCIFSYYRNGTPLNKEQKSSSVVLYQMFDTILPPGDHPVPVCYSQS